jgi:hypothetical protein
MVYCAQTIYKTNWHCERSQLFHLANDWAASLSRFVIGNGTDESHFWSSFETSCPNNHKTGKKLASSKLSPTWLLSEALKRNCNENTTGNEMRGVGFNAE